MTDKEILTIVLREMTAIGQGWRLDWSDFDGRTLRDQLNSLASWAEEGKGDYTEGTEFIEENSSYNY